MVTTQKPVEAYKMSTAFAPASRDTAARTPPLNCVVTGQVRSGAAVLQTALCCHPHAFVHGDLLHASDKVRKREHSVYFGEPDPRIKLPAHCAQNPPKGRIALEGCANPERYLTMSVLPRNEHDEAVIGLKLLYPHITHSGLWEYLERRQRSGRFCAVHVLRNPLACYVSLVQAKQSKVWRLPADNEFRVYSPSAVRIEPDAFVAFARQQEADYRRVRRIFPDTLEVAYRDILFQFPTVLSRVCRYLEIRDYPALFPTIRRLPNRAVRCRIANFENLRSSVPDDLRRFFRDDLY